MPEHVVKAVLVGDMEKEWAALLSLLNGYADAIATSVHQALAELDRGGVDLVIVSCATGQQAAAELIAALDDRPYLLISCEEDGQHLISASCGVDEPSGGKRQPLAAVVSKLVERACVVREASCSAASVSRFYEAVITVNDNNEVEGVSPAAERMFQYAAQEVIGRGAEILLPLWLPAPHRTAMAYHTVGTRKNGSSFPIDLSIEEMSWGGRRSLILTLRDLTSRPARVAPIEGHAEKDDLTGLFRQQSLAPLLAEALRNSDQFGSTLGLLMVEVDHLALFNEMHGRVRADEVLSGVAKMLSSELRDVDRVIRYRCDDIVVILQETSESKALATAERVRRSVNHLPFIFSHGSNLVPIRVSVSVGTAFYPADGETAPELLQAANDALQEAKRLGCDRVISLRTIRSMPHDSTEGT